MIKCVYLDQNVISELRDGKPDREYYFKVLRILENEHGIIPIYSWVHDREIAMSGREIEYYEALDILNAGYLSVENSKDLKAGKPVSLERGKSVERFKNLEPCGNIEFFHEGLLAAFYMASSNLSFTEIESFVNDLELQFRQELINLSNDISSPLREIVQSQLLSQFKQSGQTSLLETIKNTVDQRDKNPVPLPQTNADWTKIDQASDEDAVRVLLTFMEESQAKPFLETCPPNAPQTYVEKEGLITGLAFSLFTMGLTRSKGSRSGDPKRRAKPIASQFRDCMHIEQAAPFSMFFTRDKGAKRLSSAAYKYAGIKTVCGLFENSKT